MRECPLLFAAAAVVLRRHEEPAEGEGRHLALRRRHQRGDVERHQPHREAAVRRAGPVISPSLGHALLVGGSTRTGRIGTDQCKALYGA